MGTLPAHYVGAHGAADTSAEHPELGLQTEKAQNTFFCCFTCILIQCKLLKVVEIHKSARYDQVYLQISL